MTRSDRIDLNPDMLAAAAESRAWPFEEAKKIVDRYAGPASPRRCCSRPATGRPACRISAPSARSARTTMVRHAFRVLTEDRVKTRLLCFSDDMDGLRKVPDNVPNKEMLRSYLRRPLTRVPDPFGDAYPPSGRHNNARLRAFLDRFGFEYEFASSTEYYSCGPLRRDAGEDAGALRRHHGDHAAHAAARSARRPIRPSCPSIRRRAW